MMHALLTDLDQIQDASDNMKFSRNVLDHSDHLLLLSENCTAVLSNILLFQDISILPSEYFVMADLLRAVAGEDSDSDGETGVDHDEEDAHLEKEPADRKVEDADVKIKGTATCPSRQAQAWTCPPGAYWLSVQAGQLLFHSCLSLR